MTEFFQGAVGWLTPLFVISAMANVGFTQRPAHIWKYLQKGHYLSRMLLTNFLVVPAVMIGVVHVAHIEGAYAQGLILFGCAAGAPLLIKLTAVSDNTAALGATVQMVLMIGTVVMLPILLPLILGEGVRVDTWPLVKSMLFTLVLPIIVGMIFMVWLPGITAAIQPIVAKLSNIALYALLASTLIGYAKNLASTQLWWAVLMGVVALLIAFTTGYADGYGNEELSEVAALGTAQRNTAAALISAQANFEDPTVFVTVSVLNTVMMFTLLLLARLVNHYSKLVLFQPLAADPPQPRSARIKRVGPQP